MVAIRPAQEPRMVLHNVCWEAYERLLWDQADASAPRFTYDRGTLEIMSPLPEHERLNRALQLLLPVVAEETGVEVYSLGSTTLKREDLQRGIEPDSCFYIQHAVRVRGRTQIDLTQDPPPDLVIEIDLTHSSIDTLSLYAQIGVQEVWRYAQERLDVLVLERDRYSTSLHSRAFPLLTADALTRLLPTSMDLGDTSWIRGVRAWLRALPGTPGPG